MRGAGLAGALASVAMAFAVLVGLLPGASPFIFLIGALGGALYGFISAGGPRLMQAVGAVAAGGGVFVVGVVMSNRWLGISGFVGSLLAVAFLTAWRKQITEWSVPVWIWGVVAIAAIALLLVPLVIGGGTLDHDESSYALKAKAWLFDTPESGWGLHRGPAMSVYAYPILALNGTEPALRGLGVVALVGLAAATWWLGSHMSRRWVGPVSAVAILASPPMLRRATEFLSDIPSAALLMICMVVVWREFGEKKLPTYRLLWVVPLAWLAFYLRYQSLLSLALIALTILVLWWPKVRARPGPLISGAVVGLVGFVPHFLFSVTETGSPTGVLSGTTTAGGRDFRADGLVDYAGMFGWTLGLFLGPIFAGLLLWWLITSWRENDQRTKGLFLFIPAVALVLALGILGEAHERFVFFSYALLVVAGLTGLSHLSIDWRDRTRRAFMVGLSVILIGGLAMSVASSRRYVESRRLRNEPLQLASYEVQNLVAGRSCGVLSSYIPQITFYSECSTVGFWIPKTPEQRVAGIPGNTTYMVLIEKGKRQPSGDELDELIELSTGDVMVVEGERDAADLYIFEP